MAEVTISEKSENFDGGINIDMIEHKQKKINLNLCKELSGLIT